MEPVLRHSIRVRYLLSYHVLNMQEIFLEMQLCAPGGPRARYEARVTGGARRRAQAQAQVYLAAGGAAECYSNNFL